jgi:hypothetical protein
MDDASSICEPRAHVRSALLDYCGHDPCDNVCRRRRANLIGYNAQFISFTR